MCGIIGYLGNRSAAPILIEGLQRMEYRGYDSAGLCLPNENSLGIFKAAVARQSIAILAGYTHTLSSSPTWGMAHTRWATHGEPIERNAHPHSDCEGRLAVVHNGIIENQATLRAGLEQRGHRFCSETDSEVLAHLIEEFFRGDLTDAVRATLKMVEGTYGLVVIHMDSPRTIVGACNGSPMIVGFRENEWFLASDASAFLAHTRQNVRLEDLELVTLTDEGPRITTLENGRDPLEKPPQWIDWDLEAIEKEGFAHHMGKEIFRQPQTLRQTFTGRLRVAEGAIRLGGISDDESLRILDHAERFIFIGCGTSWHAALIAKLWFEKYLEIQAQAEYASEFRYRNPVIEPTDVVFVISQSGETIDTLAALKLAKEQGAKVFGIVNVVGSAIAHEAGRGIYLHAGPEIGVASTKAFTSQMAVLAMLLLLVGQRRGFNTDFIADNGREAMQALQALPDQIERVLETSAPTIDQIVKAYGRATNYLYLGRGQNFPVALEGALKLKEITQRHAEGYPAAEMKHGPIAMIDELLPVVLLCTREVLYEKILGNVEEVVARKGPVIAIVTEGDVEVQKKAKHSIIVPATHPLAAPILSVVPLQLLAYQVAVALGEDPDRPRNLAKAVTVE